MRFDAHGRVLFEGVRGIGQDLVTGFGQALGTPSAEQTATLVPIYGPSVNGEHLVVESLDLDPAVGMLAGISYRWHRPFRVGEEVTVRLAVDEMYERGPLQFAVLGTRITARDGELIQTQTATFIERPRS